MVNISNGSKIRPVSALTFSLGWWPITAHFVAEILPLLGNTLHKKKRFKNPCIYCLKEEGISCTPVNTEF
jgi:hypothetical protein